MRCAQGDKVKKGQVLGYIEQLGTFMPVQARHLTACVLSVIPLTSQPQ